MTRKTVRIITKTGIVVLTGVTKVSVGEVLTFLWTEDAASLSIPTEKILQMNSQAEGGSK